MIRSLKFLILAFVCISVSFVLTFSFPNGKPLGEQVFSALGIPFYTNPETQTGVNMLAIGILVVFLFGLIFLFHSFQKYQLLVVFLTIFVLMSVPSFIMKVYQSTAANGVYAITYGKEYSSCEFQFDEEKEILNGECSIPLRNHSNDILDISIELLDWNHSEERKTTSLMTMDGPLQIQLRPNESKIFHFEKAIDVSQLGRGKYPYGGNYFYIDLILSDGKKNIELSG
ncbi:hypothetical protein ACSVDE_01315 [Pseudalkalibacillus sp. Hm43]|uniref:hypothetical protein n=1 Tax=Pseudalkalibacillus sp. Hm43 TaxID=3450742 RepID=UPI003F440913